MRTRDMHEEDRLPQELERVADQLRHEREDPPALEMDLLKQRVRGRLAGVTPSTGKKTMRSRITAFVVALATIAGTTGAAIALAPKSHPSSPPQEHNASHWQYRPGKGCGDRNHQHTRKDECKKHDGHGHGHSHSEHSEKNHH